MCCRAGGSEPVTMSSAAIILALHVLIVLQQNVQGRLEAFPVSAGFTSVNHFHQPGYGFRNIVRGLLIVIQIVRRITRGSCKI